MRVDFQTGFPLRGGLRYDPFFRVAVGDVVLRAEVVEEVAAADAEAGFEGGCGVIETCVDYLVGEGLLVCLVCGVRWPKCWGWAYRIACIPRSCDCSSLSLVRHGALVEWLRCLRELQVVVRSRGRRRLRQLPFI